MSTCSNGRRENIIRLELGHIVGVIGMIRREYILPTVVALVSGVITVVSLFLPWAVVGEEWVNAFQMADAVAETLNIAFVKTFFNFLVFFGGLIILGSILMLMDFEVGVHLIHVGSILSIIFTVLGLMFSSLIPLVLPHVGIWLCLCCGTAGVISPKLRGKTEKP